MQSKIVLSMVAGGLIISIALILLLTPASEGIVTQEQSGGPILHDAALKAELVAEGLKYPTSMRFLDDGSMMVLLKNDGQQTLSEVQYPSIYQDNEPLMTFAGSIINNTVTRVSKS